MNNSSIKEYYLKLLAKYSLAPTFILILLLSILSITYDHYVSRENLKSTLSRNKVLADQILQNFNHSTALIAKSSFSTIALRFGDFSGYRSVVVPWISDDKTIEGLIMFDENQKPVLAWPSDVTQKLDLSKIPKTSGLQAQNQKLLFAHDIYDNTERLGSLVFVTDAQSLGLDQLNLSLSMAKTCTELESGNKIYVCAGESSNQKLLFSVLIILISVLGLLIVFFFSISRLAVYLAHPVRNLHLGVNKIRDGKVINWKYVFDPASDPIFRPIGEHFSQTVSQLRKVNSDLEYKEKLAGLARKLAHDIRSPLSALSLIAASAEPQSQSARDLMTTAVKRINDISLDLLKTAKAETQGAKAELTHIQQAINEILMEKQIQYSNKPNLRFKFLNERSDGYVFINENEFKCSLSNLLNNSIEAMNDEGEITVRTQIFGERCVIEIQDQGIGITPEVLSKLGKMPVSSGKEDSVSGSGIGVYNASKLFAQAQGTLKFESVLGHGTRTQIELPLAHHSPVLYVAHDTFGIDHGSRLHL